MSETKYKRSLLNVLRTKVPGAREHVALLFGELIASLLLIVVASFFFIKALQIGQYGEIILSRQAHILVIMWFAICVLVFAFAMRVALLISYRVAGPIRRVERLLDEVLVGKSTRISLRVGDSLYGISERINRLIEQRDKL